jgi:hypothetical protein
LNSPRNKKVSDKDEEKIITHILCSKRFLRIVLQFVLTFGNCKKEDALGSSVIAGDETWCLQYDPPTKRQIEEPRDTKSPASNKPLTKPSKTKTMMISIIDCRGAMNKKFVPQD